MAVSNSVKKKVRERDKQQCCECGMTAEEHKRRFGRTLHVHRREYSGRYSLGSYDIDKCETLCEPCHWAKHSLSCAARMRDGYVCTECGVTDDEHRQLHSRHLEVHCTRGVQCNETEWSRQDVKLEECVTLCDLCHLAKHTIYSVVFTRDGFQCVDCGTKPSNNRLWRGTITVHRLSGDCRERTGPDADPGGSITLCQECHQGRHPDTIAEYVLLGGQLVVPNIIAERADKLGITLPITSKGQLSTYKEYLTVVNFFVQHFRQNGTPRKSELRQVTIALAESTLAVSLLRNAAEEAIDAFRGLRVAGRTGQIRLAHPDEEAMRKMTEDEKKAYVSKILARENQHLDFVIKRNAEPRMTMRLPNGRSYWLTV